jgi:hypothetical protein
VNLAEDITEMKNLAAENPQVVQQLEKLHEDWFEQARSTATGPRP